MALSGHGPCPIGFPLAGAKRSMGACQDSACAVGQITFRSSPRPAPDKRDASRSSRTFGAGCDGRVWRIRRMRRMRTEKLWRPDASTLASSRQGNPAGDGGKKARSPGRPQRKPLKPSRRECRIVSANLWWLTRVLFTLRTRLRASQTPGIPCALFSFEGRHFAKPGCITPRECSRLCERQAGTFAPADDWNRCRRFVPAGGDEWHARHASIRKRLRARSTAR